MHAKNHERYGRPQDFFQGRANSHGVGVTFFLKKVDDRFSVVALKTQAKTIKWTTRTLQNRAFHCNCQCTKHFTTFPGASSLTHACGRPWWKVILPPNIHTYSFDWVLIWPLYCQLSMFCSCFLCLDGNNSKFVVGKCLLYCVSCLFIVYLCLCVFVFFCSILHSCCIIMSTVGWTWWDWSPVADPGIVGRGDDVSCLLLPPPPFCLLSASHS